jgi:hypothetical protein
MSTTYEVWYKVADPIKGQPARFRRYEGVDRGRHSTDRSEKEFRDLIFDHSLKSYRVEISGGPARKLRRNDIRMIPISFNGNPIKPRP